MKRRRAMYRRLSKAAEASYPSRLMTTECLINQASAALDNLRYIFRRKDEIWSLFYPSADSVTLYRRYGAGSDFRERIARGDETTGRAHAAAPAGLAAAQPLQRGQRQGPCP